jgi:hypothetical protein
MPADVCNMATSKHKYVKKRREDWSNYQWKQLSLFFQNNRHTKPSQFYASQIKEKLRNLKTL